MNEKLGTWTCQALSMGAVLNVSREKTRYQASIIWPQLPGTEAVEAGGVTLEQALATLERRCMEDAGNEMAESGAV